MASQKPLILNAGTTQRIPDADTLVVGVGIDAAAPGVLTIGGTTATSITLGSATIPVNIPGGVTTVGGTTFTTDATFDGNVTFGAGAADTVTFAALTTVTSDINFGGAPGTYKITNLANGTNPNDAVNFSQLSAIVSGVSSFQTSLSGLTPSSATGGAITLAGTLGVTSGGTGTATAFTQGSVVFAGASGVYDQDNANLFFDNATNSLGIRTATPNEALTVSGVISVGEGSAPTATAAFGKLWANSAADARPYWTDDTGQSFNLTLDRFNTLTPAASVAIDTSPALPVFNSLSLDQNTTFTTTNLGNGRSASVRVVCDGTTRSLTFPGGWTWLGSGVPPTSLAANDVGYLSITAYGATDADVVAAWSYENQPVPVTGTGVDNQISIWSGTNTQDGSANLTFDGTTLGVTGAITQSGGAVSLTGNAASSLTTSSGNLTLTGGAALLLTAAAGNEVVVNDGSADVDFRVEGDTNTHAIFVQGSDSHVGIGTSNVSAHLFNVGAGVAANFSVASGGRIHTYGGAAPTDGQILIGDTVQGRFEAASLTAGSGVTITPGAGSITISATGTDSTLVTLTTAQAANTAVTVGGAAAIATAASTSRVAGIVTATNTVKVLGICTCDVEGALSIAAGDVVYLSASEAGAVTNVAPSSSGQVVAELGIATAASSGGTVAALWQPKAIIVL
jgi:hypothetical protein